MIQRFDHVPVVVRDLERARMFFALLCFAEDKAVVIKGPVMDAYMGVPGIEADHVPRWPGSGRTASPCATS